MPEAARRAAAVAALGALGLAAAMGIGRFAFTPMLPLMQAEGALDVRAGGLLASANYLGYLVGALALFALRVVPSRAARGGLLLVTVSTAAMALTTGFAAWWVWRFVAGLASAAVLVGVSGWALPRLAARGDVQAPGRVYAGVGAGICAAGLGVLAIAWSGAGARAGWWLLALAAAGVAGLALWRLRDGAAPVGGAPAAARVPAGGMALPLACYGATGFGYIVPATFLPAAARAQIADPAVFGWIWPAFGLAAALSTLLAQQRFSAWPPRRLWASAQAVMGLGVLLPALDARWPSLLLSALLVGGTFMVVTMAGLQEARRLAGAAAPRWLAAFTAAFATGQWLGPLALPAGADLATVLRLPCAAAALLLWITAALLARRTLGAS